jgi:hypothetical protein
LALVWALVWNPENYNGCRAELISSAVFLCEDAVDNFRRPYLRWFIRFSTGYCQQVVHYSRTRMQDRTETLTGGSKAPEFLLPAANRDGIFSLSGFLSRGTLIAEFLRGTW